jgi:hypothetical protein
MNVEELRKVLEEEGVDPADYRIGVQPDESTYCLKKQGKVWQVFWFERGTRRDMQRFKSEAAACEYFLNQLLRGRDVMPDD